MVSQNRNRFVNGNFDLDLSYITERVMAMGLPGESYRSIYRNSKNRVEQFFHEVHDNNVKIYNLLSEDFV